MMTEYQDWAEAFRVLTAFVLAEYRENGFSPCWKLTAHAADYCRNQGDAVLRGAEPIDAVEALRQAGRQQEELRRVATEYYRRQAEQAEQTEQAEQAEQAEQSRAGRVPTFSLCEYLIIVAIVAIVATLAIGRL